MLGCILELEGPRDRRQCAMCYKEWSPWRCVDCVGRPSLCTDCCINRHSIDYLHHVERWVPKGVKQAISIHSLYAAGLRVNFGHGNRPCEIEANASVRKLTVVDITGVHSLRASICDCPGADKDIFQLLTMGLYPGSVSRPRTCFTFRVLDDFLLANKVSGIAAQSYFERLRRLSNSAFPHRVPNRYRELLRTSRQWRNLKYRKWKGYGHGCGDLGPGKLTLSCVACPRPGINLAAGWENENESWKHAVSFVMDGNFSAEHLKMRRPGDDIPLADGHGFMVTNLPYKEHLKAAVDVREKSNCHAHRAVNQANADRHDMEATGIGAVACGRHGCFVPHSVVDFQKGERQMNMDYALSQALKHHEGIKHFLIMYDVSCQYSKKAKARFESSPQFLKWPSAMIDWGIGKFHVHGHQRDCLVKYSPSFIPGAGLVDGEVIETLWAPLNRISGSTRAMSTSHRKEVIDDHMNDSNWRKTTGMVKMLSKRFLQAVKELALSKETLRNMESSSNVEHLAEWKRIEAQARAKRRDDLSVMEPYEVMQTKAPGKRDIQLLLEQEEGRTKANPGLASWLAEGLALQEQQLTVAALARRVKSDSLLTEQLQLVNRRNRLQRGIDSFTKQAATFWKDGADSDDDGEETDDEPEAAYTGEDWADVAEDPDVTDDMVVIEDPDDETQPESVPLRLPSTIGREKLANMNKRALGEQELRLREGQANDALHRLRMAIGLKSMVYVTQVRPANSQRMQTRAFKEAQNVEKVITEWSRVFTLARRNMIPLTLPPVMRKYRPLHKEDLTAATHLVDHTERNSSRKELSWIWSVDVGGDTENSEWLAELHRVNWLRQKARHDRWDEQVVLVKEEMKRTIRSFEFYAREWASLERGSIGHRSYAMRQQGRWQALADEAHASFASLPGMTPIART
ncbi:uncharacterized protein C8Q71DRAFT_711618 [Rhodofomes roseus]|uniref:CxC2-like cysteine cluster KDZ transposase-associated domain-containing protein n=1 Tax=Rhodofomes roseus TaxID=34475 RepID=A0ABQ8K9F8_9APHY|nr:uncharacterized protein C8Q71DRAFT_711618 [Rhodofomes roseus]KAH9833985.1 hypothetical protein C8Q71DRAFT_711618 [Rhodofomes roseus]